MGALISAGGIVMIIIFVIIVLLVTGSFYTVKQNTCVVIEQLGKYHSITTAGFHVKVPFIQTIAKRVDLKTQQLGFDIEAKTKDNVTVMMTIASQYRVSPARDQQGHYVGVYNSVYQLQAPLDQMCSYLRDALRSSVPQYTLDEIFERQDDIARNVNATVSQQMFNYGYEMAQTLITNIALPADVERSMNAINSAQREKEAAQSLAEAERIKVVTEAKAQAEAMQQAGLGIAAQRKAIADGIANSLDVIQKSGVSASEANQLFLFTQWTDMMMEFAKRGNSATIVLPSDFNQTSSMFEQMLAANTAADVQKQPVMDWHPQNEGYSRPAPSNR